jgi:hypothetical protein
MDKFLGLIKKVLTSVKEWCIILIGVALPVGALLIVSDVLFDTKFGVLNRAVGMLAKIGVEGNILLIAIAVIAVAWFSKKSK